MKNQIKLQSPISNLQFLIVLSFLFTSLNLLSQANHTQANLTFIFLEAQTNKPVSLAEVMIYKGDSLLVSVNSYSNSEQAFNIHPGIYNIKIIKDGFEEKRI
jgi:hypothetical protein